MSDYLSRAAERASRTSGSIRPMLPSLFDLEKTSPEAAFISPEIEQHLEAETPRSESKTMPGKNADTQPRMISAGTPRAEIPTTVSTGKSKPIAKQTFGAATSPEPGEPSAPEQITSPEPGEPSTPEQKVSKESSSQNDAVARPPANRTDPVPAAESPRQSPPPVHPQLVERAKKDLSAPLIAAAPTARRREAVLRLIPAEKRIASADRQLPRSEPTIQVTIGRLEVRAVQSAPAPPKPASTSPRISLDEYLRSRKGGAA